MHLLKLTPVSQNLSLSLHSVIYILFYLLYFVLFLSDYTKLFMVEASIGQSIYLNIHSEFYIKLPVSLFSINPFSLLLPLLYCSLFSIAPLSPLLLLSLPFLYLSLFSIGFFFLSPSFFYCSCFSIFSFSILLSLLCFKKCSNHIFFSYGEHL